MEILKVCSCCLKEKEQTEFYKRWDTKDGLQPKCKECCKKYSKEHRKKNLERVRATERRYNRENKEKRNKFNKEYYKINREKIIKDNQRYRDKNIEKQLAYLKEYRDKIAKWSTYKDKLTVDEDPICRNGDELFCRCYKCKKYFPVTNRLVTTRLTALATSDGRESRLYCGDKCKKDCDVFYAKITPKSKRKEVKLSRCHQSTNRKALLDHQLDEFGYNFCEVCGEEFEPQDLQLHHNIMVSMDISEADNIAHQILVCKDHHKHEDCI